MVSQLILSPIVAILCRKDAPRNDWPLARVTRAQVDSDGMMRRVDIVTVRGGSRRHYKRQRTNESNWITDTFPSFCFCLTLTKNLVSSGILEYQARSVPSQKTQSQRYQSSQLRLVKNEITISLH